MADATQTETVETNTDQNTQAPAQVRLPDDHPLVKTVAKLRDEIAGLKKAETAKAPAEELTKAQTELAKAKLALKYGLSEADSAHLPDGGEAGEALAKRLQAANTANGGLPVIQNLGDKTGVPGADDPAAAFIGFMTKQSKR